MQTKFDTSTIPNYEELPEEARKAIEAFSVEVPEDYENLKGLMSKKNAENAELKRKLGERMTAEEKEKAETQELLETLKRDNAAYRERERKATYANKLVEAGWDSEGASSLADLLPEGLDDDFFAKHKIALDAQKTKIQSSLLDNQPKLATGEAPKAPEDKRVADFRAAIGLK